MNATTNPGPGYRQHPNHHVELEPELGRVHVIFNDEPMADSTRALKLRETRHADVYYIPVADVRMDRLRPTGHQTYCPFKGHASYWSISVNGKLAENAVWGYQSPYDEVAGLIDHVAFYRDRVDSITIGEA